MSHAFKIRFKINEENVYSNTKLNEYHMLHMLYTKLYKLSRFIRLQLYKFKDKSTNLENKHTHTHTHTNM